MPEFPDTRQPNMTITSTMSLECVGSLLGALAPSGPSGNTTFGTANLAIFYPWKLECPMVVVKGVTYNGSTATGNVDVGIYDFEFNRLVSHGGTAQSGTAVLQEFDITDTTLLPGRYWMALATSSASSTFQAFNSSDEVMLSSFPIVTMAAAYPLPATATPAKSTATSPSVFLMGFSSETTI